MCEERTIENSWTRKRLTLRSLFSRACACARVSIEKHWTRGEERKTTTSGLEITNRNWQSRFRFDFLDRTIAERRCSSTLRFRERVNKPKNRYTPEGVERARRSREPSKLGNIEGRLEVWLA